MKAKKLISLSLILAMSLAGLTACGGKDNTAGESSASGNTESQGDSAVSASSITILNGKGEVQSQIEKLASTYGSKSGVTVNVKTPGAGVDLQATLKGYYLSDNMPDIITCESASFANWQGLLVDMKDEEWAGRTDSAYVDSDYGTIGFPYTVEAIGLIYNADLLEKAGIDPAGLTSPSAYETAFKTLDDNKKELGLTAAVGYCAEALNLGWSTGNHIFGTYLDAGLARDDTTYIDKLNDGGQFDDARLSDYAKFIELLNKYSDPALLTTGTYDDQVKGFASGRYAFVTQGSWIGALLTGDDKAEYDSAGDFKIGMAPYAFTDGTETIMTSAPSWWAVMKEGHTDEAKAFLQWCSENDGQQILVEEAGFISPYTDCKYVSNDPIASAVSEYISSGKTSAWHWLNMKDGLKDATAPVFLDYASGELDASGFATELKKATADYYAK